MGSVIRQEQPNRAGAQGERGGCISQLWIHYLVLVAGPLTVLSQTLQRLVDQCHVLLVYIQPQKSKSSSCAATDTVQELQCLTHQVVVCLVVLAA